ncbi:MAG: phytoene dehydrogenase [Flavobacteriaceae bacterium]|nr:phytoene dehydrogenase [Flavobacteriaceae bacterium]
MKSSNKSFIVLGSGIGGMAAASTLAYAGYEVTILEQSSTYGGKAGLINKNGYNFDTGPSLLTLPDWIDEVFNYCNKNPRHYFDYDRLDVVTRYFFSDKTFVDVSGDIEKTADNFENIGLDRKIFIDYMSKWNDIYEVSEKTFLSNNIRINKVFLNHTIEWLKKSSLKEIYLPMAKYNHSKLSNEKIELIMNRFATYTGSSPYNKPAFMNQLGVVEMMKGAYFPRGGIRSISKALYQLCLDVGVKFNFNCVVSQISYEKSKFRISTKEKSYNSLKLVSNIDFFQTQKLLQRKIKIKTKELSTSCVVFYWGITKEFPKLKLHNIIFSGDYKKEFSDIFNCKNIADPTIYINISSKMDKSHAPTGCENWFVMINVPAKISMINKKELKRLRDLIIKKLSIFMEENIAPLISFEEILTPKKLNEKTGSYEGSLYGENQNSFKSIITRKKNQDKKLKNLFYVGGTVRPGGGMPLAAKSGIDTAKMILKDES